MIPCAICSSVKITVYHIVKHTYTNINRIIWLHRVWHSTPRWWSEMDDKAAKLNLEMLEHCIKYSLGLGWMEPRKSHFINVKKNFLIDLTEITVLCDQKSWRTATENFSVGGLLTFKNIFTPVAYVKCEMDFCLCELSVRNTWRGMWRGMCSIWHTADVCMYLHTVPGMLTFHGPGTPSPDPKSPITCAMHISK